ncbi:hypothetical protein [Streptomyces gardneri]|uniref:hypothetical protein n=1 Tax=Streptomyces gardneri TaxID=66892 RepID=UPI0011417079|nr:hypothetical protein [Streptomyces gardneri]
MTVAALAVPVWLCGAVVLPPLLEDPAIRWPLASTLGTALAALAALWGYGFATRGRPTTGPTPSSPSAQATAERAVAIGGNNHAPVSTGDAPAPTLPAPAGPAAGQPSAPPAPGTVSASGERSIAIGGNSSGSLATGDRPGSPNS